MSSSTDSLKKKVCVTVFLDELFEEVLEDDWKELRQVSDVTESQIKIAEKPYSESSRTDLGNDEKVNVSSNADPEQLHVQLRPRKHRRESKFSKNHCDSFENELTRYDYGSCDKGKNDCLKRVESTASESDFVLDEFLKLDKGKVENKSSSSEPSELELKKGSFLPTNPILSSMMILHPSEVKISKRKSAVSSRNISTQFDGIALESSRIEGKLDSDYYVEKKEQKAVKDMLPWKETQKQIRLILARSSHWEKEICEGDRLRHYDLLSILDGCTKTKENTSSKSTFVNFNNVCSNPLMDFNESDLFDSYTCVFPHNKQKNRVQGPEVKEVWDKIKKTPWNDGFESGLSEASYRHNITGLNLKSYQKDALFSCSPRLKCEEKSLDENINSDAIQSLDSLESSRGSSLKSIKSRESREANLFYETFIDLAKKTVFEAKVKEATKNEEGFPLKLSRSLLTPEGRHKNFAEGDTFEKSLNQDSKLILDIKAKEKIVICDEILKQVAEPKVIRSKIIINRAEIEFDSQENKKKQAEIVMPPCQSLSVSEEIAEIFFKQKDSENMEKNITDVESVMIFAESENFCDSEDFLGDGFMYSFTREFQNDVCIVQFEDKLPRSKILRRTKTVEILGDSSLNDMKNISTEIILICENLSNKEICLEAWHKSASVLKSFSEMRQCYLKDSKDSSMYLIEIPLNFIRANGKKQKCHRFFGCSDSD